MHATETRVQLRLFTFWFVIHLGWPSLDDRIMWPPDSEGFEDPTGTPDQFTLCSFSKQKNLATEEERPGERMNVSSQPHALCLSLMKESPVPH
jgi:hypothetical protein